MTFAFWMYIYGTFIHPAPHVSTSLSSSGSSSRRNTENLRTSERPQSASHHKNKNTKATTNLARVDVGAISINIRVVGEQNGRGDIGLRCDIRAGASGLDDGDGGAVLANEAEADDLSQSMESASLLSRDPVKFF
jgi:hypothetical protein